MLTSRPTATGLILAWTALWMTPGLLSAVIGFSSPVPLFILGGFGWFGGVCMTVWSSADGFDAELPLPLDVNFFFISFRLAVSQAWFFAFLLDVWFLTIIASMTLAFFVA